MALTAPDSTQHNSCAQLPCNVPLHCTSSQAVATGILLLGVLVVGGGRPPDRWLRECS